VSKTSDKTQPSPRSRAQATRAVAKARGGWRGARRGTFLGVVLVAVFAVVVLYLVYQGSQDNPATIASGSGYKHVEGQPGTDTTAPEFTLTSNTGEQVSLADFHGKSLLLYFQEGLSCQPCWDQIKDLEQNQAALQAAGVDAVVSITTDPANLISRKVADENLTTPVLSDPTMQVSEAYDANSYGMMGNMRDGHSFILVGPDGTIRWRADYGGAPDYTMFLPTDKMLADLNAEQKP
jgi:peroxiredoxin